MGSVTKNWGGMNAYRASKAALNILTSSAAIENPEIVFSPIHPGWVDTDGGRGGGGTPPLKPLDSVKGILDVVDKLTLENSGKFYQWDGTFLPW